MEEKKIEYEPHGRKLNPCELEIDLFCKGVRIHESCEMDGGKAFSKARAGLGSGLELMIPSSPKNVWLNAPVLEYFAASSPYELRRENGAYHVVHTVDQVSYEAVIPSTPEWYFRKTSSGVPMREIGVIQGTYLGVYLGDVCNFWQTDPKENCKFCATGIHVGKPGSDKAMKTVKEVVEVAQTAKAESGVSFVHFNTGYQKGRGLDICAPFVKAIKEKVGALAGVQAIPSKDLWKYDWIIDCGADHFSFCYELHNPKYFAEYLPGKERLIGQKTFFNALEYTASKLGKGRVSGEIIAGIEPIEDTLKAIDYITSAGAFPTICIFRPVQGTAMAKWPSPSYEDMIVVFRHMYEACVKNMIPIGLVPNIEVSLVVQPNDAEYLIQPSLRYYVYKAILSLLRYPAGILFRKQLKPHPTSGDACNPPVPKGCCCQGH